MPVFTVETAHIAAQASVAARRLKAERPMIPAIAPLSAPLPTVDDYTRLRLVCVRAQLGQVDRAILAEAGKDHPDGQRLNWLAQAQDRLADQERVLAGRPLPGSRRPSAEPKGSAQDAGAWIVDTKPACGSDTTTGSVQPAQPEASTPQDAQVTQPQQVVEVGIAHNIRSIQSVYDRLPGDVTP